MEAAAGVTPFVGGVVTGFTPVVVFGATFPPGSWVGSGGGSSGLVGSLAPEVEPMADSEVALVGGTSWQFGTVGIECLNAHSCYSRASLGDRDTTTRSLGLQISPNHAGDNLVAVSG